MKPRRPQHVELEIFSTVQQGFVERQNHVKQMVVRADVVVVLPVQLLAFQHERNLLFARVRCHDGRVRVNDRVFRPNHQRVVRRQVPFNRHRFT